MNSYILLIILSLVLIISYFFNYIQRKWQISAVILLVLTGVIFQLIVSHLAIPLVISENYLRVFGTLGLLIIVLEAVVDLEIHQANYRLLLQACFMAFLIVCGTGLLVAMGFSLAYNLPWHQAIIYALPLAIISSAIVIPSVGHLNGTTKEFLILESIFSDIIGVLLFNFMISSAQLDWLNLGKFSLNFWLMIVISLITTLVLGIILSRDKVKNLHIVILAVLVLVYSVAHYFHLSALLLILIFGVFLRNLDRIINTRIGLDLFANYLNSVVIHKNLHSFQELVEDLGFMVRSVFFILLGYSIKFNQLLNWSVLLFGIMSLTAIYAVRWLVLRWVLDNTELNLATMMAPRGLITVLLFFQIPDVFQNNAIDTGVTFFVVIISGLIMTSGLLRNR
ncbi:MAG: hypothetical protein RLZZ293_1117 [Pseudomonadota bacterium]|jgi:NhaP-type Na+/H+ or K+/H+ antiporter